MPTLRLTQHLTDQPDQYHLDIALDDDDHTRQTAAARFAFDFTPADREELRWYLEDYLQYPLDPAPAIAARIEGRMAGLGAELFRLVFESSHNARKLWFAVCDRLNDTRVEIVTDAAGATALPWELLRDPTADAPLALSAQAFVRAYTQAVHKAAHPGPAEQVRILLVICRPGGQDDVPFRSVSGRLLKSLTDEARRHFVLDVLRPATYEQLSKVLRQAKDAGRPYHIVHFDGHGGYLDLLKTQPADVLRRLTPTLLGAPRSGPHGYLLFEAPQHAENLAFVDGPALGQLLVDTGVPVLVLNACRSAHADLLDQPDPAQAANDPHSQVRAFGSLAQEVMDAGVAGVVAMRYNVYVVTAAQFVADLYAGLAAGQALGQAVSLGRRQLHAQPLREIAFDPRPLQDWPVPVVYEAASISLFPPSAGRSPLPSALHLDLSPAAPADNLPRPDAGFYGRDETLLALDRAFDREAVVLLHAYAGSGKTMTAAEFARWYKQTGGLAGPVLFTSFEQYHPLARVLDTLEQAFGPALQNAGVEWLALSDDQRRQVALQVLAQVPVLWLWDNIEPVNGFPAGTPSAWPPAEQQELKEFLKAAAQTKAKFLLTSRRDERAWLGDLPARVVLPPMPMPDRVELARALAHKQGRRLSDVADWRPLLAFTQGNPLTLTVLVGQALRDGLHTRAEVAAFVQKLRQGEAAFSDEAGEGRAKSLGASLSYGFTQAFTEDERRVLALLHFFQGFVDVNALRTMGHPERDWCLPEVRGLTREAGQALLDRAAGIGLLTAHGGGYYAIHPALPWFFKGLFEQYYALPALTPSPLPEGEGQSFSPPPRGEGLGERATRATRAFVEAIGELGNYCHDQYIDGHREVIAALRAEEANLLHARALARRYGWWPRVISAMQGLRTLYDHTGRRAEWQRLVEEITPDFVADDDLPRPGREEEWGLINDYRVQLAREARRRAEAERWQRARVDWDRRRAAASLTLPPETLMGAPKDLIRKLAVGLHELGQIQRELGQTECVQAYEETATLSHRIGDQPLEAIAVFNLGHAYIDLPALRDLDAAERWYRRSLDLRAAGDRLGRGKCLSQLGLVAYERFQDARQASAPEAERLKHLNAAADYYHQALALTPPDDVDDLAVAHNQLGIIYKNAGDLERALSHYNESIRYKEMAGNVYSAGTTRFNIALTLRRAGRLADALLYAHAALRNFEPYGQGAAEVIQETQRLIAQIEQAQRGG